MPRSRSDACVFLWRKTCPDYEWQVDGGNVFESLVGLSVDEYVASTMPGRYFLSDASLKVLQGGSAVGNALTMTEVLIGIRDVILKKERRLLPGVDRNVHVWFDGQELPGGLCYEPRPGAHEFKPGGVYTVTLDSRAVATADYDAQQARNRENMLAFTRNREKMLARENEAREAAAAAQAVAKQAAAKRKAIVVARYGAICRALLRHANHRAAMRLKAREHREEAARQQARMRYEPQTAVGFYTPAEQRTPEELKRIHDEREEHARLTAAVAAAKKAEAVANERMRRAETEERKQAAAELRRLPAQHGPAPGIAGSQRRRTAEEERAHAEFTSPEARQARREYGEAQKELKQLEKQLRIQQEKIDRRKEEDKKYWSRYAEVTQRMPGSLSLADGAARGLTEANVRALASGAGPSSSRDDDDASNWNASVTPSSVPTSAWPMEMSGHATKQQGKRAITNREIQEALKHGDKHEQANGRIRHRHPMYSSGYRLVVITEADGTFVVTEFDRDNDL